MDLWSKIKRGWMAFVTVLGHVQTTLLLILVYHLSVGPIAMFAKLSRQAVMDVRPPKAHPGDGSYAVELKAISSTLDRAKRQF